MALHILVDATHLSSLGMHALEHYAGDEACYIPYELQTTSLCYHAHELHDIAEGRKRGRERWQSTGKADPRRCSSSGEESHTTQQPPSHCRIHCSVRQEMVAMTNWRAITQSGLGTQALVKVGCVSSREG
jgi:hypothetical protein